MLNVKGLGITCGIFWAITACWCVLMSMFGIGNVPFDLLDQFYLGWLSPTIGGLILGIVLAFVDGLIFGFLFGWVYNKISK